GGRGGHRRRGQKPGRSMTANGPGVRIGVVGVGHLGRHHARLLAASSGAQLVGIADVSPERAGAAEKANGCPSYSDYRALIGKVDAVSIAVPTLDHLRVARDFLDAGVHVLVEKPMTSTLAEAQELVALADRAGCVLAVGHTERFNPAVAAAIPMISAPRFIEVHRLSGFPDRSLDIDVVFDVMIHDLDIVLAIDRSEVLSVDAVGVPVLSEKVDIANARLKFASGCTVNLTASRISRDRVRKVRFFQRDQYVYVSVDYGEQELEAYRIVPGQAGRPAIDGGTVKVEKGEPLGLELQDFVDAIREGRAPRVTGQDGYRALALATRVAEAIQVNENPPGVPGLRQ
ncbi:MAG: Gfo/Idh/MocA family oxidoreductase, partial [Vicinamibacterales bacterium]